jgi:hypothetical protein
MKRVHDSAERWAKEIEKIKPLDKTIATFMEHEREIGEPFFLNVPDRWFEPRTVRCLENHVSTSVLRCSIGPQSRCLACGGIVALTFPEDDDGPLMSLDEFKALRKSTPATDHHDGSEPPSQPDQ